MSENHWELLILLAESFRQLEAVVENAPHMTVAVEAGGAVRDEEGTMLQEATGIKDLNEKGAMSARPKDACYQGDARNEKFFDLQGRRVANQTNPKTLAAPCRVKTKALRCGTRSSASDCRTDRTFFA